jgi:hypothetical protein
MQIYRWVIGPATSLSGVLIVLCAVLVGVLVQSPGSSFPSDSDPHASVYPPMTMPLLCALAAAGLAVAVRPAVARIAGVVVAVTAMQVVGICVVAQRDWYNFAGAGFMPQDQAAEASGLAERAAVGSAAAALLGLVLMWRAVGGWRIDRPTWEASVLSGIGVAMLLPLALCAVLGYGTLSAIGQFALWWSVPWGVGLAAAGVLQTAAARTAWLSVAGSALLTAAVAAMAFGLHMVDFRLPD